MLCMRSENFHIYPFQLAQYHQRRVFTCCCLCYKLQGKVMDCKYIVNSIFIDDGVSFCTETGS